MGLAMLVRDEADVLPETLPPLLELVDSWTVLDTGSVDDTPQLVQHIGMDSGKPGRLERSIWDGFAGARSKLLHLAASQADFTLMLDADHKVEQTGERPDFQADSYLLPVRSGQSLQWRLPLLTRSAHPFVYRGAAHSYLWSPAATRREPSDWLTVQGGPGASAEKLEGDYHALLREATENPEDSRAAFYLAETCRFTGRRTEARRWYLLRSTMGGWDEEVYWAKLQLGILLGEDVSAHEAFPVLAEAFRMRPTRAEALRAMANLATSVADKLPVPDDVLFVRPGDYTGGSR